MYPYSLAELYPKDRNMNARWFVKYGIWDANKGKIVYEQKRVPKKLRSAKEREKWAKELIAQINTMLKNGITIEEPAAPISTPETVNEVIGEMLRLKKAEVRKKSASSYQSIYKKFEEYLQATNKYQKPIESFLTKDALGFRDWLLLEKTNTTTTANKAVFIIQSFFKMGVSRGKVKQNPFEGLKPLIETQSARNKAFTPEHQNILESWMQENDPVLYLFTRFMYSAFIRPKELRQLRGKDIDLKQKKITVWGTIAKNRKTQSVPINSKLLTCIGTKIESLESTRLLFGKCLTWLGTGQCSENYVYNRHLKALEICGLNCHGYTLYSWKHTGACRAIEAGVNPRKLQGLLRHSSLEETDIYLRSLGISLQNEELKETW